MELVESEAEGECFDVVVVGAGMSGLRCALALCDEAVSEGATTPSVAVLEADSRVGGRTMGVEVPAAASGWENGGVEERASASGREAGSVQLDLGGQWIGPTHSFARELAERYKLELHAQFDSGTTLSCIGDKRTQFVKPSLPIPWYMMLPLYHFLRTVESMCVQVPVKTPWSCVHAEEWDAMTLEGWVNEDWCVLLNGDAVSWFPSMLMPYIDSFAFAVLGVHPSRVSFLWFLWFVHQCGASLDGLMDVKNGAQQDKISNGTVQLAQCMAAELGDVVRLQCSVQHVEQPDDHETEDLEERRDLFPCRIYDDQGNVFRCKFVVFACPPPSVSRISTSPPLPALKMANNQAMPMGNLIKCIATYRVPFWREQGFSGEAVLDGEGVRLVFDASVTYHDHVVFGLIAFFAADSALLWSERTVEERQEEVVRTFRELFDDERAEEVIAYVEHDWGSDEWRRGAPMSIPGPGVLTESGAVMRKSIGRLHFAGTEMATYWSGYIEGALRAGVTAAEEVRLKLNGTNLPSPYHPRRRSRREIRRRQRIGWLWSGIKWGVVASALIGCVIAPYMRGSSMGELFSSSWDWLRSTVDSWWGVDGSVVTSPQSDGPE